MKVLHVLALFMMCVTWCRADAPRYYVIPVIVHNVHDSRGVAYVSDETIRRQLEVINTAFLPAHIHFRLDRIDRIANDCWTHPDFDMFGIPYETMMLTTILSKPENNPDRNLNIFITDFGDGFNGISSFPWDFESDPYEDAVVISYYTTPSTMPKPLFLGYTAVHEIGHWLGLLHTFNNEEIGGDGCTGEGDEVDDTPREAIPSYDGLPRKTCKGPGLDPVDNFMDYSPDGIRHRFTKGQIERMREMLDRYRYDVY
jgi:hypothetical protein